MNRLIALACALCVPAAAANAETVISPDGRIVATLDADGEGVPYYEITRDGETLIAKSNLGFNFTDANPMRRNFEVAGTTRDSVETRWEQPWGERQWVDDRHSELALTFRQRDEAARQITVRMRVFDDGVGFRYELPENTAQPEYRIAEELTEFVIAPEQDATAWWIQGGDWNRYEYLYKQTPLTEVAIAHTRLTVRTADGTHLSFHEAALIDYSGMWLRRMEGNRFRAMLAPSSRGAKVVRTGAFTTPWRTIRIAALASSVVASTATVLPWIRFFSSASWSTNRNTAS